MQEINLKPVGVVHPKREKPTDDNWDDGEVYVELDAGQFNSEALHGMTSFSHAEILFYMHNVDSSKIVWSARHPRNNLDWPKVGIFAQRAKIRPNRIGATIYKVLKVEGTKLFLQGLDAIDETPVLDIKPWVPEFGPRDEVKTPDWITEIMRDYWEKSNLLS